MNRILNLFLIVIVLLNTLQEVISQNTIADAHQPQNLKGKSLKKGRLLLLGGGILKSHAEFIKKFANEDKHEIIIIPTAYSDHDIAIDPTFTNIKKRFEKLGINNIRILHTRDRKVADSDEFTAPIKKSYGIVILGGKTQQITEAYRGTETHKAMLDLLNRGGIIAGVSAGSGVQANYFSDKGLETGFGFLENVIIMNHFLARNKQFDHVKQINARPDKIAIGIDDNTGILVEGDRFEVIGKSYVAIYDKKMYNRPNGTMIPLSEDTERFYLLKNGDRYNLVKRQVESNSRLIPLKLPLKQLYEYEGKYRATEKDFQITILRTKDTLKIKNSWGWTPYPIFPYKKDIFYATNRNMWFQFIRDPDNGRLTGLRKMKSILQKKTIVELKKD